MVTFTRDSESPPEAGKYLVTEVDDFLIVP